jgi:hypothetical protein
VLSDESYSQINAHRRKNQSAGLVALRYVRFWDHRSDLGSTPEPAWNKNRSHISTARGRRIWFCSRETFMGTNRLASSSQDPFKEIWHPMEISDWTSEIRIS